MRSSNRGFTLIELLIVVVIIGILAAIAIPKFGSTKEKAYIASMKADLRNLVTAEESYFRSELLIVVVIIGILAAIAIPKFGSTKEKAYIASMKADLRNLVTAEESYFAENVTYTTTNANLAY